MIGNQNPKARRNRKGFTLIELLVVVLILAILMAVALPLYLSAIGDSQKKTCRANMQTIANAVQAARVKNILPDYSTFIAGGGAVTTALEPDLQSVPVCPNGGNYTISQGHTTDNSTFQVNCDFAGNAVSPTHGKFEPGVDSN